MRVISMTAVLGVSVALIAAPALAQNSTGGGNSLSNAAAGLGLVGSDVPALLVQVKADPYKAPAAPACDTIPAEILQLSNLIGPDLDSGVTQPGETMAHRGMEAAKGLVPYSGVLRFVTGASKKDKDLHDAVAAGYARRGFLRGMEVNLKCGVTQTEAQAADSPPATPAKKSRKAAKGG
ncbi:hypothetical protein [Phenylobacterium sp.]|uniref:hypothetical protein n=1 Tax=Phenylobacterium sp. TaxID=1871053 RepID=UPI00122656FC|nr:hypothetical protein [Phenylobacterium sp.]THD58668.1 MAG: hypothetical protein E8A49_19310 [Phenylobacterium sp.]